MGALLQAQYCPMKGIRTGPLRPHPRAFGSIFRQQQKLLFCCSYSDLAPNHFWMSPSHRGLQEVDRSARWDCSLFIP